MCMILVRREDLQDPLPIITGDLKTDGSYYYAEVPDSQKDALIDSIANHVRGWISVFTRGCMEQFLIER